MRLPFLSFGLVPVAATQVACSGANGGAHRRAFLALRHAADDRAAAGTDYCSLRLTAPFFRFLAASLSKGVAASRQKAIADKMIFLMPIQFYADKGLAPV
jgi:hypothetical protein